MMRGGSLTSVKRGTAPLLRTRAPPAIKMVMIKPGPAELEPALLEYLDHLYLEEEEKSDVGGKLASALAHHYNQYVRLRRSQVMPTFASALKAFDKLNPSLCRETLPAPFVNTLAGEQLRTTGAHLTLLGLDTYLRPGIIIGLMEHNVIDSVVIAVERRPTCLLVNLPSQRPSKQELYSSSVLMDSPPQKFLGEYLERLKVKALPHALLFNHTQVMLLQSVRTAGTTYQYRGHTV